MNAAVVGIGLVSPAGLTSSEHALFVRAGVPPPQPSPFVLASGEPLRVGYCPWLGARASLAQRLGRMGITALYEAARPLEGLTGLGRVPLFLCMAGARPSLPGAASEAVSAAVSEADRAAVEQVLVKRLGAADPVRLSGEASAFAALVAAEQAIAAGSARAAVIVAVDSFVATGALCERLARAPSPWAERPLHPSEGCAAVVVMDPALAADRRVPVIGHVLGAAVGPGASTDDDDEIVDGAVMTRLLREMPRTEPIGAVFGQLEVDSLRQTEWLLAMARAADRFDPEHESRCLEGDIGAVGAASGAMSLAYGFAVLRHDAARSPRAAEAPFAAWAVSRDGARGVALARLGAP